MCNAVIRILLSTIGIIFVWHDNGRKEDIEKLSFHVNDILRTIW